MKLQIRGARAKAEHCPGGVGAARQQEAKQQLISKGNGKAAGCRPHVRFAGAHQPARVVVQVPLGARHSRGAGDGGRRSRLRGLRLRGAPLLQARERQMA